MSFGRAACISISLLILSALGARAQSWRAVPGSFLEPSRFGVVSEIGDSYLWLEAGFGRDIVSGDLAIGLEGLIWRRLRSLSGFRFPVETADYFFGPYATFDLFGAMHRFRVSHISAHLVDGADTVVGGSSSRFSREFVSLERSLDAHWLGMRFFGSVGVRYVFHQVTEVEPALQLPATLNASLLAWGDSASSQGMLLLTASADAGPSWPAGSAGLTSRLSFSDGAAVDLFARYYFGVSRAGIEGKREERQLEIGLHVIPLEWFD
jgi:hypothetical protein